MLTFFLENSNTCSKKWNYGDVCHAPHVSMLKFGGVLRPLILSLCFAEQSLFLVSCQSINMPSALCMHYLCSTFQMAQRQNNSSKCSTELTLLEKDLRFEFIISQLSSLFLANNRCYTVLNVKSTIKMWGARSDQKIQVLFCGQC